mmetsp:Transcript_113957/g.368213  ORF Transcript_113957/g.368213 Transcript_113957/m.368213 type:complete len:230 (+) Transcript_113957:378-1067(+)
MGVARRLRASSSAGTAPPSRPSRCWRPPAATTRRLSASTAAAGCCSPWCTSGGQTSIMRQWQPCRRRGVAGTLAAEDASRCCRAWRCHMGGTPCTSPLAAGTTSPSRYSAARPPTRLRAESTPGARSAAAWRKSSSSTPKVALTRSCWRLVEAIGCCWRTSVAAPHSSTRGMQTVGWRVAGWPPMGSTTSPGIQCARPTSASWGWRVSGTDSPAAPHARMLPRPPPREG